MFNLNANQSVERAHELIAARLDSLPERVFWSSVYLLVWNRDPTLSTYSGSSESSAMGVAPATHPRRHDLDALRGAAMILGIVYHAALSLAVGFPWFIQDPSSDRTMYVFQAFVHGFRMPLFFLISGFFTAMLWQRRGSRALVWHRFRRVLLPCLVGLVTIVPVCNIAIGYAMQQSATRKASATVSQPSDVSIWAAIRRFDSDAVRQHLAEGFDTASLHPDYRITALTWAALIGDSAAAQSILETGCSPNIRNQDGGTALHAATFLGRADVAHLLMEAGADVHAKNNTGETPLGTARGDLSYVPYITGFLALEAKLADVKTGRNRIVTELESRGATAPPPVSSPAGKANSGTSISNWMPIWLWLTYAPIFSYLWFLWMLWWLVLLFVLAQGLLRWLPWPDIDWQWMLSPSAMACMIVLTLIPISNMDALGTMLGPDTAMGIVPMPHVLLYYGLFFCFGIAYFFSRDTTGTLGRSWPWMLPLTLLVVFPIALELSTGIFGWRQTWMTPASYRMTATVAQSLFAWWMALGCIGWFQSMMTRERAWVRYMSDASYWLYVTHLPLVVLGQVWVMDQPWPAWLKLMVISMGVTSLLLVVYHFCVRSTWIGVFLNGSRLGKTTKPVPGESTATSTAAVPS
jgi:hypothetical protein